MAANETSFGATRAHKPMSYLAQRRAKLRAMLREHPDGLTIKTMLFSLPPVDDRVILADLRGMPDAYIDRWIKNEGPGEPYLPVWCVVVPPPDCPRPGDVE